MAGPILYLDLSESDGVKGLRARVFNVNQTGGSELTFETSVDTPGTPAPEAPSLSPAFDALAGHREIRACSRAVVLIRDRDVAFRHTSLPFSSPKKIAQVLPLELDLSLPWPDQPCLTDFFVHKISFAQGRHLIFSASVPEPLVREIAAGLKRLGVSPEIIAPKGYTAAHSFLAEAGGVRDAVFIHFTPDGGTLVLASDGKPSMVRSFTAPMPAQDLAREIHRTCTGWRQLSGLTSDFSLILSKEADACARTAAVFEEFQAKATAGSLKDLPEFKEIKPHTTRAGHFPQPSSGSLINFCKGDYGPGGTIKKYLGDLTTAAVIAGLAAVLFFAGLYLDVARLERKLSHLRSREAAIYQETFPGKPLNPAHPPLLLMQSQIKAAQNKQKTTGADLEKPPAATALDLLYALSKSVPKAIDADLTRLLFSQNHVTLTGSTNNFNAVDRLKTALEKSPLFTSVTIITAEAEKAGGRVMFKFRVEME